VRDCLQSHGSCHPLKAAASHHNRRFLLLPVDQKSITARMACPLRSMGITPLHRYYRTVRPCPTDQYFRPRGAAACAFSLITAEQVLKFRTRAQARVTPPVPRTPHGQYPGFRHAFPGERGRSGFDATSRSVSRPHQWFTCIRLSNPHMT
jgi:hypothetical protein